MMSADNGIYILSTVGPEFRVKHLMAVENVYWDEDKHRETNDQDTWIIVAREMWSGCEIFYDAQMAIAEANRLYEFNTRDGYPVEYGIQIIHIDRKF